MLSMTIEWMGSLDETEARVSSMLDALLAMSQAARDDEADTWQIIEAGPLLPSAAARSRVVAARFRSQYPRAARTFASGAPLPIRVH